MEANHNSFTADSTNPELATMSLLLQRVPIPPTSILHKLPRRIRSIHRPRSPWSPRIVPTEGQIHNRNLQQFLVRQHTQCTRHHTSYLSIHYATHNEKLTSVLHCLHITDFESVLDDRGGLVASGVVLVRFFAVF